MGDWPQFLQRSRTSVKKEKQAAKASLEDIKRGALEHYEELATSAHHWSSFIHRAIKQYQDWIPIGEYLPEDKQQVIFYTTGFRSREIRIGVFLKKDQWDRSNMFVGDGFLHEKNVSHWMPVPIPPPDTI
jgi:hypothetical protein